MHKISVITVNKSSSSGVFKPIITVSFRATSILWAIVSPQYGRVSHVPYDRIKHVSHWQETGCSKELRSLICPCTATLALRQAVENCNDLSTSVGLILNGSNPIMSMRTTWHSVHYQGQQVINDCPWQFYPNVNERNTFLVAFRVLQHILHCNFLLLLG